MSFEIFDRLSSIIISNLLINFLCRLPDDFKQVYGIKKKLNSLNIKLVLIVTRKIRSI